MERMSYGLIVVVMMACGNMLAAPVPLSTALAPEPGPMVLMATGLFGFAGYLYWKRRRQ
jgi:hypothetical protein